MAVISSGKFYLKSLRYSSSAAGLSHRVPRCSSNGKISTCYVRTSGFDVASPTSARHTASGCATAAASHLHSSRITLTITSS